MSELSCGARESTTCQHGLKVPSLVFRLRPLMFRSLPCIAQRVLGPVVRLRFVAPMLFEPFVRARLTFPRFSCCDDRPPPPPRMCVTCQKRGAADFRRGGKGCFSLYPRHPHQLVEPVPGVYAAGTEGGCERRSVCVFLVVHFCPIFYHPTKMES